MLKVISFNANGIRAAARKGFFDWFAKSDVDVLCIQETKAWEEQLDDPVYHPDGYHRYIVNAEKKGYSGVAIYTRHQPVEVNDQLSFPLADSEGRFIQCRLRLAQSNAKEAPNTLDIISLYLPSGSSGEARQALKYEFMDFWGPWMAEKLNTGPTILCGDWNIVHTEKDIKNWKANQKNSGCLPEERAWLDHLFDEQGWVDGFRVLNQDADEYTWWSQRGQARTNNVGWRIDYQIVTPDLAPLIREVGIYREENFSDHAPLVMSYALEIEK